MLSIVTVGCVQVACKTLGYKAGSQLLAGASSPLPGASDFPSDIQKVACTGEEETLADCDLILTSSDRYNLGFDYGFSGGSGGDVVLLCSNPSGASPPFYSHVCSLNCIVHLPPQRVA